MTKKRYIILFICIIVIIFLIFWVAIFFPYIMVDNEENNKLFESYNAKLTKFEHEMNEIATSNNDVVYTRWNILKNRNYDSSSLQLYDYLIQYLNNCYLLATYDGTNINYSNYLSKFSGIKRINKNDFKNHMVGYEENNIGCLKHFSSMKVIIVDNEKMLNLIDEFDLYYNNIKNKKIKNYNELLQNEMQKIDLMLKVTDFLKNDI